MGSRTGVVVAVALVVAVGIGLIVWSSMGLAQVTVEACFSYRGRTQCATATGASREEALRTAAMTACATISSGVSETIGCQDSEPVRVEWK